MVDSVHRKMKLILLDAGIILIVIFVALGYVHYNKFHDGKVVDLKSAELQTQEVVKKKET